MSTVQSLRVGQTRYTVKDPNAAPVLDTAKEATLISTGTYLNEPVTNGAIFTKDSGELSKFVDTITGTTVTWTNSSAIGASFKGLISYGNGVYLLFRDGSTDVYTSTDGSTWTVHTGALPFSCNVGRGRVIYAGGYFMLVQAGGETAYSTDGINWTNSVTGHLNSSNNGTPFLEYFNGVFVCNDFNRIPTYSTDNGANWNSGAMAPGSADWPGWSQCYGIVSFKGKLYCATSGQLATSTNGTEWTIVKTSFPSAYLCANDERIVALTSGSGTWSEDGINWFDCTGVHAYDSRYVHCIWTGEHFVESAGHSGRCYICISTDGKDWMTVDVSDYQYYGSLRSIATDGTHILSKNILVAENYTQLGTVTSSHAYSLTPLTYTKTATDTALATKQGVLTAGTGISIDPTTNTISATGGGGAGWLTGASDPTSSTESLEGQRYLNIDSGKSFISTLTRTDTPQYTVIGSPTISSSWVLSGISASSYLKSSVMNIPASLTTFDLVMKMRYVTGEYQVILGAGSAHFVKVTTNNTLTMYNNSQDDLASSYRLTNGSDYWVRFVKSGNTCYLYCCPNSSEYTLENIRESGAFTLVCSTTNASQFSTGSQTWYIGRNQDDAWSSQYCKGSIYLKDFNILVDNVLFWGAIGVTETKVWKSLLHNQGTGSYAIAIAEGVATASGTRSVAIGYSSSAVYTNCIAIGYLATAGVSGTNTYCTAIGSSATATGSYSTAIGSSSQATAARTTSIGYSSRAIADNAVAIGYMARTGSSATGSVQLGQGTNNTANTLQFKDYTVVDADGIVPSERLGASGVIIGTTDPTVSTTAVAGQRYLNKNTGDSFVNSVTLISPATTNYTSSGSVSVDANYVATFASGAYLRPNINWNMSGASSWSVVFKFTMPSSAPGASNGVCLMRIGSSDCMIFLYKSTPRIVSLGWSAAGTTVAWGQTYWYKLEYNSSTGQYNTYISTTETFPSTPSYSTTSPQYTPGNNVVVSIGGKGSSETFTGSIDLSTMKWYKNDSLVWEAVTPPVYSGEWVKLQKSIAVLESLPAEPVEGQIYFITGSS